MSNLVRRLSRRRTNEYTQSKKSKSITKPRLSIGVPYDRRQWTERNGTTPLAPPICSMTSQRSLELSGGQYDDEVSEYYQCTPRLVRVTSSTSVQFNLNKAHVMSPKKCDISAVSDATNISLRHRNSEVDCSTPLQSTLAYPQNSTLIDQPQDSITIRPQLSIKKRQRAKRSRRDADIVCRLEFACSSKHHKRSDHWWYGSANPARPHHYSDSDSSLDISVDVDDTVIDAADVKDSDARFDFLAHYDGNRRMAHLASEDEDIIPDASMIAHRYSNVDMQSVSRMYTSRKSLQLRKLCHQDEMDQYCADMIEMDTPTNRKRYPSDYSKNWVLESSKKEYVHRRYSTSSKPFYNTPRNMTKTESVKHLKTKFFHKLERKRYVSSPNSNGVKRGQHHDYTPQESISDTWYISPEVKRKSLIIDSDCTSYVEKSLLRPLPVTAPKNGGEVTRRKSIVKRLKSIGRQLRTGTRPKNNLKTLAII